MTTSKWVALKIFIYAGLILPFSSCMSAKHIKAQEIQTDLALRQMHSEIEEQKYKLSRLEVELQITEGKTDSQSKVTQDILKEVAKLSQKENQLLDTTLQEIKKRISAVEEAENKLKQSLNELALVTESHAYSLKMHRQQFNEADSVITDHQKLLNDLKAQLKTLLLACEQEDVGQVFYVVQKGDSLSSISKDHTITEEKLLELNQLCSQQLVVGQKIRLK